MNLVWPYLSGTVLYDEILPGKVSQSEIGRYGFALLMLCACNGIVKTCTAGRPACTGNFDGTGCRGDCA